MFDIDTKCVQAGYDPGNGEPRVPAIAQTVTYAYSSPEEMGDLFDMKKDGFFYSRLANPTVDALEKKIAALDGGTGALCCSSGMAAISLTALNFCSAGDNFVASSKLYGGTHNLFKTTLARYGIECRFVDPASSVAEIEAKIDGRTKFAYAETLANPAMDIADFDKLRKIRDDAGVPIVIDNTLATPAICRPLDLGADITVYSSTKYLEGHATSLGGIIVEGGKFEFEGNGRFPEFNAPDESYRGAVYARDFPGRAFIAKARAQLMRDFGATCAPFNAFMTIIGADTLHLRMRRHSSNALAVARMLKEHPRCEWVRYGGLESDPNHSLAQKYFCDGMASGMVAFGIRGGRDAAIRFQKNLKLFKIVTHIADARSCALHPASTTHRQLSDADLVSCGITDNLIRLSVGLESERDILADVKAALDESVSR